MGTTTGTFNFYDSFKEYLGDGTIDLDGDTFKVLLTSSAYTPNAGTHTTLTDITNELSGNGYARQTLTSVTWTEASGTVTFDSADPQWTASGGSIVARYWVLYDDTPTSPADPLIAYGLLDNTPADVTTTDGNTLTASVNASGWFDLS